MKKKSHWLEAQVRYNKQTEKGVEKVTETYAIEAYTFGEAEAGITAVLKPYVFKDSIFEVKNINPTPYSEVVFMSQAEIAIEHDVNKREKAFKSGDKEGLNKPFDWNPTDVDAKWYRVKVTFYEDKNGVRKRISAETYLVQALNADGASKNVDAMFVDSILDYEKVSVVETAVLDVYARSVKE